MAGNRIDWRIFVAVVLALVVGATAGESGSGLPLQNIFDVMGTLFISALKMLAVPLVSSSLIVGVAGMGSFGNLGRLGLRTISFFLLTSLSAILFGILLVNLAQPGILNGRPVHDLLALDAPGGEVADELADQDMDNLLEMALGIVPANVVGAAAGDDLLGIVFFSILFGFFMSRLDHSYADPIFRFWSGVSQIMMAMTGWVMAFAPIGIFGLVASAASRAGTGAAVPLVGFVGVVLAAMAGHAVVTLPLLMRVVGRISPLAFYRIAAPVAVTAVSTASSLASLPLAMERIEKGAGVSTRITSLVLPLGATMNLNGTALYNCAAAIFLAQAYGLTLDLATQLTIVAVGTVASIGAGGNAAAPLLAVAIMLATIGVPTEAVGVLIVVDRFMEMARTGLNLLGDMACAVMVARTDGEKTLVAADADTDAAAAR